MQVFKMQHVGIFKNHPMHAYHFQEHIQASSNVCIQQACKTLYHFQEHFKILANKTLFNKQKWQCSSKPMKYILGNSTVGDVDADVGVGGWQVQLAMAMAMASSLLEPRSSVSKT